ITAMSDPLRVAVVGSGPAGFYAAGALLAADPPFEVDMIERLPTPWGLVRLGVAPDHPKIKSVSRAFEKIAEPPGFRFLGNVEVARDLELASADVLVDPAALELDAASEAALAGDTNAQRNLEVLRAYAARQPSGKGKTLRLRFCVSPVAILGDGRVEAVEVVRNALVTDD